MVRVSRNEAWQHLRFCEGSILGPGSGAPPTSPPTQAENALLNRCQEHTDYWNCRIQTVMDSVLCHPDTPSRLMDFFFLPLSQPSR